MLPDDMIAELKEIVSAQTGTQKEHIWIHVTHVLTTPHPPRPVPGETYTPQEEAVRAHQKESIRRSLTAAVQKAAGQAAMLEPAQMGTGIGHCGISVNRDMPGLAGWWIGAGGDGPANARLTVLRVESPSHRPIGILYSYGMKPGILDQTGRKDGRRMVSADVIGHACRILEGQFRCPALFFLGSSADQIPREQA